MKVKILREKTLVEEIEKTLIKVNRLLDSLDDQDMMSRIVQVKSELNQLLASVLIDRGELRKAQERIEKDIVMLRTAEKQFPTSSRVSQKLHESTSILNTIRLKTQQRGA